MYTSLYLLNYISRLYFLISALLVHEFPSIWSWAITVSSLPQFVADGVFKAELNAFLSKELAEDGYSGVEVRVTPTRTEIIILATRTQNVLGEKGRRIRELTAVVQKRFSFPEGTVEVRRPGLILCISLLVRYLDTILYYKVTCILMTSLIVFDPNHPRN